MLNQNILSLISLVSFHFQCELRTLNCWSSFIISQPPQAAQAFRSHSHDFFFLFKWIMLEAGQPHTHRHTCQQTHLIPSWCHLVGHCSSLLLCGLLSVCLCCNAKLDCFKITDWRMNKSLNWSHPFVSVVLCYSFTSLVWRFKKLTQLLHS